ncbi:TetR/AcrR family transcriptional regulator [Nocardioides mangrovi]|uniref:TetR/AcrR family transcriptional regulator n=1 Tax=Nocardioides mangrovi TaxID=2874580 RepID=A0ABS7U7T9_9ACTN|nr:TetR/AcrR family transcriptional regulator [Nocardioides mangrovi]MBZ5737059.1 TetR/AcrR family transcriptional regulator [Nocardioides mangrovi]
MVEKREKSWQAGPLRIRVTLPGDEPAGPKERLTVDRIVDAAMSLMAEKGYDAVSMRSLAKELGTGPASLYAHVASKEEVDQLVLDRIGAELHVPAPDADHWDEQLRQVLRDMLALYRRHPGSARAAIGMIPTGMGALRTMEGMLAICDAGGISPQASAWFCDLAAAYVSAIAVEEAIWVQRDNTTASGDDPDHTALDEQLRALMESLPAAEFPLVTSRAGVMTAGDGDDRFEFGVAVLVAGLAAVSEKYR